MAGEINGLYQVLNPTYIAPGTSEIKDSFIDIYNEMYGVVGQLADPNQDGIVINGRYFDNKTDIASMTAIGLYTDELSQRGQLLLKMLEFENKLAQTAGQAAAK